MVDKDLVIAWMLFHVMCTKKNGLNLSYLVIGHSQRNSLIKINSSDGSNTSFEYCDLGAFDIASQGDARGA